MQKKPRKVTKEDIEAFEKQYPAYGKIGKVMPEAERGGKIAAGPGAGAGGTVAIILKMLINPQKPTPTIAFTTHSSAL